MFVFALTQVTALISDDPTRQGLGRGLLVLAALWWAWGAYAWLTNEIDADEDLPRLAMFTAMIAMLIVALAVPTVARLGGIALYFLGHVAFRLRLHSGLGRGRLTAAVVSLALIPVALEVEDALGALAIAAGVSAALIAYEVIRFAEGRATLRAGAGAQ